VETAEDKKGRIIFLRLTAKQEGLLLTTLPIAGTAVLNFDDENIRNLTPDIKAKNNYGFPKR